jgi:hypothetical protein
VLQKKIKDHFASGMSDSLADISRWQTMNYMLPFTASRTPTVTRPCRLFNTVSTVNMCGLQALQQIASLSSVSLSSVLQIWREMKATRIAASAAKDSVALTQELASLAASTDNADSAACLSVLLKAIHSNFTLYCPNPPAPLPHPELSRCSSIHTACSVVLQRNRYEGVPV